MKSLSDHLLFRLDNWHRPVGTVVNVPAGEYLGITGSARLNVVVGPFPIHRFIRVNFAQADSPAKWRYYSDYAYDITIDGNLYSRNSGLSGVGQTKIETSIGRSPFSFAVLDDDRFLDETAERAEYRGCFVHCDIHFAGEASQIRGGLYRDTFYEGALDGISISRLESGKFLATLQCASPFAALDEMIGRQGSKEDQKDIDPNDTSMDEAIKPVAEDALQWGQPI